MAESMIHVRGLCKTYRRGGEALHVLDHLDLDMEAGRYYALMGPSGSGKTTLLNLVGGLDHPDEGTLVVGGENLGDLDGAELAHWRASNVGFVFQGFNLIPVLTALENVELPLLLTPLSAKKRREHADVRARARGPRRSRASTVRASSRAVRSSACAIARAIATDPKLILADEPTGDLDRASADQVLELLGRLNREHQKTILMVTHDPHAAEYAERIVHLDKGKLGRIDERARTVN